MNTISESSLSRIYNKVKSTNVGIISAHRGGGEKTPAENDENSQILRASLINAGFDVTKVIGTYVEQYGSDNAVEVREVSFIVAENDKTEGKLVDFLIKEGTRFNQDSVLIKPKDKSGYLYGISKHPDAFPPYKQIVNVGFPVFGKEGEFFTSVRRRPFTFESAEQAVAPNTNLGRYGLSLLSKQQPK